tara:strand:+ start:2030 stop:2293 length:264 start_codon:yes stop_codon:yes gene_type:complete
MPRQKRPVRERIRRKCHTCGSIKWVEHRQFHIPTFDSQGGIKIPTYNPNAKKPKHEDIKGVVVENYCSIECAGDDFINNYTEDDFLR